MRLVQRKISVLGHFAEGLNLLNGQTVKTKIITDELRHRFGKEQISAIDTHGGVKVLIKAPVQVFSALKNSKNVLILPAHNGLRVYAPLLFLQKRLFKERKLHYVVIGGWLPEFLQTRRWLAKVLRDFDYIYVETSAMKGALEEQGFANVYVMPNCKDIKALAEEELVCPKGPPFRLCTFSRVMKEKGIEDAVEAVKAANKAAGQVVYMLDIYGQIDVKQTGWFNNLQRAFPDYIHYCGCVDADKSVEVLKNYLALLFPTYYVGEGFAGTLIDAYSAGIPVIASDWKYNAELVNERVGCIYPTGDQTALIEILNTVAADPSIMIGKRKACIDEAGKYRIDKVAQVLIDQIERN